MRLSITALATTVAFVWGGCLFVAGVIHLMAAGYGVAFLNGVSSVYPGFHAPKTATDVLVGTCYGLVDGAFSGLLFGWIYNAFVEQISRRHVESH